MRYWQSHSTETKQRLRKVQSFAQSHIASLKQSQGLSPDMPLTIELILFCTLHCLLPNSLKFNFSHVGTNEIYFTTPEMTAP